MAIYKTNSAEETKKLAAKVALTSKPGDVLLLFGELGAGKTTFTQGLAEALDVKGRVTSPTFVFYKSYVGTLRAKPVKINHLDCYRIEEESDAKSLGLSEVFDNPHSLTIIEWPERIKNLCPKRAIKILFKVDPSDNNKRVIEIGTCHPRPDRGSTNSGFPLEVYPPTGGRG